MTVSYSTVAVTATSGSDYTLTSGLLTIPAGQTSGQVNVPVLGDVVDEDDETLEVRLTGPSSNASVADDRAVLTITDDDSAVADVGVTLADAPDPVVAGSALTYTATVTNNGPDRAPCDDARGHAAERVRVRLGERLLRNVQPRGRRRDVPARDGSRTARRARSRS